MIRHLINPIDERQYNEYLQRQGSNALRPSFERKLQAKRPERVAWFQERFAALTDKPGTAICLGARFGEEVEALDNLSWDAFGIDLNPYPPWVRFGDINRPRKQRYNLIYTNAIDHCRSLPEFLANIRAACDLFVVHFRDGEPGEFETVAWDSEDDVLQAIREAGFDELVVSHFPEFYGLTTEVVCR